MIYLLDTNACIALMNGMPASVRTQFARATKSGSEICVSAIAGFELWYGAAKNSRPKANHVRLEAFFAGPVRMLAFDDEDARVAGSSRAALESAGRPIGAYDLLIAGQAVRHRMTLVTANVREFSRVKGLSWDWGERKDG